MIMNPEIFIAIFTLLSLAGLAGLKAGGYAFPGREALAMLTVAERAVPVRRLAPKAVPAAIQLRTMAEPVRGPIEVGRAEEAADATQTHIGRLNGIVAAAVDTARNAERLHRGAHEQVDAAHYALQNLLNELSLVMPVAAPGLPARTAAPREAREQTRRAVETAMAA